MSLYDLYAEIFDKLTDLGFDFEDAKKKMKNYSYAHYQSDKFVDDKRVSHIEKEYKNGKCVKNECECLEDKEKKRLCDDSKCCKKQDENYEKKYKELWDKYNLLNNKYEDLEEEYKSTKSKLSDITKLIDSFKN